jgi:ATP-dependent RNA helicase SUPV3L1/SUV3
MSCGRGAAFCLRCDGRERGWAWTRAILGLPAIELHLCGSPAFVELVQQLAEKTGARPGMF